MWNLIPRATQILIVVALGVLGASLASWLAELVLGQERPPIVYTTIAATLITLLIIPLAQSLWRPIWRLVPRLRKRYPDLNGTWTGHATPANADGGQGPARPATIQIRQDLFGVQVSLKTDQLTSHTTHASLEIDEKANALRIRYMYTGNPPPEYAKANPRHDGAACLEYDRAGDGMTLIGHYFTDRRTAGALQFQRVAKKTPARQRARRVRHSNREKPAG